MTDFTGREISARYLLDGSVEMLGRLDTQVKVRGFRVELSEIEAVLKRHPRVQGAAVALCQHASGTNPLVGYVVLDQQQGGWEREISKWLSGRLPEYMLPGIFLPLEAIPLTPNGKVDRKALPVPDAVVRTGEYIAPATHTEVSLARIWADLLGLDAKSISATANFFELGGHSLLSVRLLSQIRSHLGVELQIKQVFEAVDLKSLALALEQTGVV